MTGAFGELMLQQIIINLEDIMKFIWRTYLGKTLEGLLDGRGPGEGRRVTSYLSDATCSCKIHALQTNYISVAFDRVRCTRLLSMPYTIGLTLIWLF